VPLTVSRARDLLETVYLALTLSNTLFWREARQFVSFVLMGLFQKKRDRHAKHALRSRGVRAVSKNKRAGYARKDSFLTLATISAIKNAPKLKLRSNLKIFTYVETQASIS
jgi:hypothetical protein